MGITDAGQIADTLNAPFSIPNPAPQQRTPKTSVTKTDVQGFGQFVLFELSQGIEQAIQTNQDTKLMEFRLGKWQGVKAALALTG